MPLSLERQGHFFSAVECIADDYVGAECIPNRCYDVKSSDMKLSTPQFAGATFAVLIFGLAFMAAAQIITPEEAAQRNTKLTVNAKHLANGLAIYEADYDQTSIIARSWTKSIVPYIGKAEVMTNPWRPGVKHAFTLNNGYIGIKARGVENPGALAMVFSGEKASADSVGGKLDLWKTGGNQKGVMAYADTHIKTYTKPSEVKADWSFKPKPAPKKTAVKKKAKP